MRLQIKRRLALIMNSEHAPMDFGFADLICLRRAGRDHRRRCFAPDSARQDYHGHRRGGRFCRGWRADGTFPQNRNDDGAGDH